jgi:Mn2+/Fe2+ NRAMP family transporter
VANTINIASDLAAMADSGRMLTGIPSLALVLFFGILIAWATIQLRYRQFAGVLKWLTVVLFAYVATALHVGPDWRAVFHDLLSPTIPRGKEGWRMVVALLGTTISPYLLFWQASEEVEEQKAKGLRTVRSREGATAQEIAERRLDVGVGTLFANIVFFFIVLTTALTLHKHGVVHLETSSQVAQALQPLAGRLAELLYTVGLIGVGLLAIPTLAGSAAYAFAETFGWKQGLDQKLSGARPFYGVVILSTAAGMALDFLKINPVQALYWTAVINGLLAPFLLVALLRCAADAKLMKGQDSPHATRIVVGITAALMFAAAIGMFVF